ncbi:hypothetical protein PMAYCL1PPCAC_15393, partial [Pristionchus mayeri]
ELPLLSTPHCSHLCISLLPTSGDSTQPRSSSGRSSHSILRHFLPAPALPSDGLPESRPRLPACCSLPESCPSLCARCPCRLRALHVLPTLFWFQPRLRLFLRISPDVEPRVDGGIQSQESPLESRHHSISSFHRISCIDLYRVSCHSINDTHLS